MGKQTPNTCNDETDILLIHDCCLLISILNADHKIRMKETKKKNENKIKRKILERKKKVTVTQLENISKDINP